MLAGSTALCVSAWFGVRLAHSADTLWVRFVAWWLRSAVLPLLRRDTWSIRTVVIFVNNGLVLAVLLLCGFDTVTAGIAIIALGINVGIGVRLLAQQEFVAVIGGSEVAVERPIAPARAQIGMLLNLIEVPAIAIVVGMALGQGLVPLPAHTVWTVYATWVLPMLLIAAGGESTWIGEWKRWRSANPESNEQS